jgi:hypothetical protein
MNLGIYKNIQVLDKVKDKSTKVDEIIGFDYTSDLTSCALSLSEFKEASKSLPIVFIKNENNQYSALSILGLNDKNSCLKEDGKWKHATYIPAFVRRYPFIFLEDKDKLALCIDKDCKAINKKKGKILFDKAGEATEYTNNVMKFMEQFQNEAKITSAIIADLDSWGILEDAQLEIKKEGKETQTLKGFKRVNEQKLYELDDEKLLAIIKNGVYKSIVYHLDSLANFKRL